MGRKVSTKEAMTMARAIQEDADAARQIMAEKEARLAKSFDDSEDFEKLKTLNKNLLDLFEKTEDSEMTGRSFHPNTISSCRVLDGQKIGEILSEIKKIANNE